MRAAAITVVLALSSLLAPGPADAQTAQIRVIRPLRFKTSAPLSQLAALHGAAPVVGESEEINPLGMPALRGALAAPLTWADPVRRADSGRAPAPAPYLSFEGINNRNSVIPPDTNGDVGKNHYVQWVNLSVQIFDKTTGATVLGPVNGNSLWTGFGGICETNNNGDPVVLYDHLADRWIFSQFGLGADGHQCVAVSTTGDPTGPYFLYDYVVTTGGTNDYPKLGLWPDAYLYMAHEFSPGFVDAVIGGFDRNRMVVGDPSAALILFVLPPGFMGATNFAPEPANLEGRTSPPAGRPALFVQPIDRTVWGGAVDRYNVWRAHLDFAVPASSTLNLFQLSSGVPSFNSIVCLNFGACIPQPGTSNRLDILQQFTMYRPVYRNFGSYETLLVDHTVNVGGGVAGIRWIEIRDPFGTPTVQQTGTHSPNATHRWMGSLAMDGAGNILLGYSLSSSSTRPSIAYAGRSASDAPGTLPLSESILIAGSGSQTGSSRWGDYATMSVDETGDAALGVPPDCGFWFTTEYVQTTGSAPWRTRIGAIRLPGCGVSVAPTVALAVNGQHPPSGVVDVTGPFQVTLHMTPGDVTHSVLWYYRVEVNQIVYWVTRTGTTTVPTPILSSPPLALGDSSIFDSALPAGTTAKFSLFLVDGTAVIAQDSVTAVVH
jgi:hypothetical protein